MANLTPLLLNNVYSTVQAGSTAIGSASATGINVATGDGANFGTIGTNQYIPAVIVDTSTTPETVKEYVWITSRSTDALTVVRQAEETTRYPASTSTVAAGYKIVACATHVTLPAPSFGLPSTVFNQALAWTHDPSWNGATFQIPSTFTLITPIYIPYDMTVSKITVLTSAGATSPTTGQNFFGLYSAAGTRLGVTSDMSTPLITAGIVTGTLTSAATVSGGQYIYGAVLIVASSTPFFFRPNGSTGASYQAGLNFNVVTGAVRGGTNQVGLTLPSSITPSTFSAGNGAIWMALT